MEPMTLQDSSVLWDMGGPGTRLTGYIVFPPDTPYRTVLLDSGEKYGHEHGHQPGHCHFLISPADSKMTGLILY